MVASTEKTIRATASDMFNDIVDVCSENVTKGRLCNCVIDNLNAMSTLMTVGKQTQTRKIFDNMLKEYESYKKHKQLIHCTRKLNIL